MHDLKLHITKYFCSDQPSIRNKLQASIAQLKNAWMPDSRFDRDCHLTKLKTETSLDHDSIRLARNDCKQTVRETAMSVN